MGTRTAARARMGQGAELLGDRREMGCELPAGVRLCEICLVCFLGVRVSLESLVHLWRQDESGRQRG